MRQQVLQHSSIATAGGVQQALTIASDNTRRGAQAANTQS
jgi:hypothetical protein